MSPRILMLAAVALAALPASTTVRAEPYKWCAYYADDFGARNCGFTTLAQCRATISGIGGICEPNPEYTGPSTDGTGPSDGRSRRQIQRERY